MQDAGHTLGNTSRTEPVRPAKQRAANAPAVHMAHQHCRCRTATICLTVSAATVVLSVDTLAAEAAGGVEH